MSAARRRRKAAERIAAHNRRWTPGGCCPRCGGPGRHFVPPGLGTPGMYACEQLNALEQLRNHKRAEDRTIRLLGNP